jgi:XTP/dITP diphosphohydrolase
MKIYLLTKNPGKIKAASSVFNKYGIDVEFIGKEYPEIQANSSLEIARFSAVQAAKDFVIPVVREDHSLFINAIGIPGPYTSFIEEKISPEKLLKIIKCLGDNTGFFEVATVYAESDGKTIENVFQVPMTFGSEIKTKGRGWSGLIRILDETRTITEYPEEERLHIWNQGYEAIAKKLIERK